MIHGLRSYWNGCRCTSCREANARYFRLYRFSKPRDYYVPVKRAQQLLLNFEDATDAARVLGISRSTAWTIRSGKVRKIRRSTEERILESLAA